MQIRPGRRYGPGTHTPDPVASRPTTLPLHPLWTIRGPPTTERTGRLSQPTGWDGTPNLTEAQATALRKLRKKVQINLTAAAAAEAALEVRLAVSASGAMPLSFYRNGARCINVREGDPWHGIHPTHHLLRCHNTIFCIHCAGASSGNTVQWMKGLCIPNASIRKVEMPHKFMWWAAT